MSEAEHRRNAPARVRVLVLTISDTRDAKSDTGGTLVRDTLAAAGHEVLGPRILRENPLELPGDILQAITTIDCDAVVTTGGTGIAPRDRTPDILGRLYERQLPGFGELFRALSFAEIGSAAMLSRASAGTVAGKIVFSVPGSPAAVRLACERLILPELGHLVAEMRRPLGGSS